MVASLITNNIISYALRLRLWDKADQIDYVCINSIIGHAYFIPVLIWWASSRHELWPRFATCHLRMLGEAQAYGSLIATKRFSINTSWQKIKLYSNKRCGGHFKVFVIWQKTPKLNVTNASHTRYYQRGRNVNVWVISIHTQSPLIDHKGTKTLMASTNVYIFLNLGKICHVIYQLIV